MSRRDSTLTRRRPQRAFCYASRESRLTKLRKRTGSSACSAVLVRWSRRQLQRGSPLSVRETKSFIGANSDVGGEEVHRTPWHSWSQRSNLQLLLNKQARAITGLRKSTPLPLLQQDARLPCARDLLDYRQTRYAIRALKANGDHPTHQLLPANFRFGEIYRHKGATGQPSSTGWSTPEKTYRSFGSRLAQQIVRHVSYDTEYRFNLPCKVTSRDSRGTNPVTRTLSYS